jgi:hypothetical protein
MLDGRIIGGIQHPTMRDGVFDGEMRTQLAVHQVPDWRAHAGRVPR